MKLKLIYLSLIFIISYACSKKAQPIVNSDIIKVEYPETYELANIILSLTDYGKADKWEVRKNFPYYDKVQEYFKPVTNHPLLDSVNYSRKKWQLFLAFRTDSYAFSFDENNQLKRTSNFYVEPEVHPFDDQLDLINDFVKKSNFRQFFNDNKGYYTTISDRYKKTQYLKEMKNFLVSEFGEQHAANTSYKVVLSPFVYRMNCHRDIDSSTTADFITMPDYLITDTITVKPRKIAIATHNLFTEMDHGYVNPTTTKFDSLVSVNFNENIWAKESGYENKNNAVFNEYMTWAVYDIFLQKHFPELASEIGLYWSLQNNSRGFKYQQLFTQQLLKLYKNKKENESLKDVYPKLLQWTGAIQNTLTKPTIKTPTESIQQIFSEKTPLTITFSEPMEKLTEFSVIIQNEKQQTETITISKEKNSLLWSENGKQASFTVALPTREKFYYFVFNWWNTPNALYSKKGVLLKHQSFFKLENSQIASE